MQSIYCLLSENDQCDFKNGHFRDRRTMMSLGSFVLPFDGWNNLCGHKRTTGGLLHPIVIGPRIDFTDYHLHVREGIGEQWFLWELCLTLRRSSGWQSIANLRADCHLG